MAVVFTSSHTSGRPVKGNGRIRLEVRDPLLTLQANRTYNWPYIERKIDFVRAVAAPTCLLD